MQNILALLHETLEIIHIFAHGDLGCGDVSTDLDGCIEVFKRYAFTKVVRIGHAVHIKMKADIVYPTGKEMLFCKVSGRAAA